MKPAALGAVPPHPPLHVHISPLACPVLSTTSLAGRCLRLAA